MKRRKGPEGDKHRRAKEARSRLKSAEKKLRQRAAKRSQVKRCTLSIAVPFAVSPHSVFGSLSACRAPPHLHRRRLSLLPLLPPLEQRPARDAGFDALLQAAGGDDEDDADFSHPLGSAAAAPGPAAPSLKRRRDSPPVACQ